MHARVDVGLQRVLRHVAVGLHQPRRVADDAAHLRPRIEQLADLHDADKRGDEHWRRERELDERRAPPVAPEAPHEALRRHCTRTELLPWTVKLDPIVFHPTTEAIMS